MWEEFTHLVQVFFARGKLIDSAAELEGLVQNSTLIHNIGLPTLDIALIQQHFSSYIVGMQNFVTLE
jgi:hypothetical protein